MLLRIVSLSSLYDKKILFIGGTYYFFCYLCNVIQNLTSFVFETKS